MNALIKQATEHWRFVAPLLTPPVDQHDYDRLVVQLDEIIALTEGNQDHALAGLAAAVGSLIEAYDEEHRPMPPVTGADALRYLMQEHNVGQSDLPEVGGPSVVSEILGGQRQINVREAKALSARFNVPAALFLSL